MESYSNVKRYFKRQIDRHHNESEHQYETCARAGSNSNILDSSNVGVERYQNCSSAANSSRSHGSSSSLRKQFCDDLNIIVGSVRHPEYATVGARARTFESWPKKNVCIKKLTDSGFVYTLEDDIVECFQCGGVLRDWPDFADPWEQHALAFRNCPHVRRSKGDEFIMNIHGETNTVNKAVNSSSYHELDFIKLALRDDENVTAAVQENTRYGCVNNLTLDTCTAGNLSRTLANIGTKQKGDVTNDCESDSYLDEEELGDIDEMKEENRRLKEPVTCKICLDAIACIVTLPCGHMVSCFQCIPALTTCAVCRTPIKGTVRALMAVNYSNDHQRPG